MSYILQCEGHDVRATLRFTPDQGDAVMATAAAMLRAEAEHLRDELSGVWSEAEAEADELDELADSIDASESVAAIDHAGWGPTHMDRPRLRLWQTLERTGSKLS